MDGVENLNRVSEIFIEESKKQGLRGLLGVSSFNSVYEALMPIQRLRLSELAGEKLKNLIENGSVISIAYAYPEHAIEAIAVKKGAEFDKDSWNIYAGEYHRLNRALNETASRLADDFDGLAVPATVDGAASKIEHVEDYYGMVVSHRVAAELSGIGWRGKNELIVNPNFSCAIRLASILTEMPVNKTPPSTGSCSSCLACLEVCPFLRFKGRLRDYREQCRRYIASLRLEGDVCGKCIKACYKQSIYSGMFRL